MKKYSSWCFRNEYTWIHILFNVHSNAFFVMMYKLFLLPIHVFPQCTDDRIKISIILKLSIQCDLKWQNTVKNYSARYMQSHFTCFPDNVILKNKLFKNFMWMNCSSTIQQSSTNEEFLKIENKINDWIF